MLSFAALHGNVRSFACGARAPQEVVRLQGELEALSQAHKSAKAAQGAAERQALELQQEVDRLRSETEQAVWRKVRRRLARSRLALRHARRRASTLALLVMAWWWRAQDAAALEVSLREAHELLYQKQATIERLTADRAALQLRLERELATAAAAASGGSGGGGGAHGWGDHHHHQALTLGDATGGHAIHRSAAAVAPRNVARLERWRRSPP